MLSGCAMLRLPSLVGFREEKFDFWMLVKNIEEGSSVSGVNIFWWLVVAGSSCRFAAIRGRTRISHLGKERREE